MNKLKKEGFVFGKENYKFMILGLLILTLGYILMIGGGAEDPAAFNPEIFSAQRITIAPLLVLAGYGVVLFAIMRKAKD